jgi:CheY-like chemotaxis protein
MTGRRPRILCLDDQEANLAVRKFLLQQFGCDVTAVHDAQSCLAAATHNPFDLALLDYHLGNGITGEDVAHDLRVCTPNTVLVILTGDPSIPESARNSVDAVLTKGRTNPEELFLTIESLLPDCTLKPRRGVRYR